MVYVKSNDVSTARPFFMGRLQVSYKNKMYSIILEQDI